MFYKVHYRWIRSLTNRPIFENELGDLPCGLVRPKQEVFGLSGHQDQPQVDLVLWHSRSWHLETGTLGLRVSLFRSNVVFYIEIAVSLCYLRFCLVEESSKQISSECFVAQTEWITSRRRRTIHRIFELRWAEINCDFVELELGSIVTMLSW